MQRVVEPEILDELQTSDPRAVRSRKDLRLINRFMRGEDWILSELARRPSARVIEIGAGEGNLVNQIARQFPEREVVALDLIEKPASVSEKVQWVSGDLMSYADFKSAETIVVANLFIHHLSAEILQALGEKLCGVQAILLSEPHRAQVPQVMGRCLFPFINDVTRHDMIVSIKAGFRQGEIPELLGGEFDWTETLGVFGGLRVKGVRR